MIIEEPKVVTNIKEDDILLECLKVLFKTKEGELIKWKDISHNLKLYK